MERDPEFQRSEWAVAMEKTDPSNPQPPPSPDGPRSRFAEACDRFETEWRQGARPQVESYLEQADADDRPILLRELAARERSLRVAAGEDPGGSGDLEGPPGVAGPIDASDAVGAPFDPTLSYHLPIDS